MSKSVKGKLLRKREKAMKKKRKLSRKLKGSALLVLGLFVCIGCSTQPSRSQNMALTRCVVNLYAGSTTNSTADGYGDILTQAMMIENSGTETTSPVHTVSPNVPVNIPVGMGGGESLGVLGKLIGSVFGGKVAAAAEAQVAADCAPGDPDCAD